MRVMLSSMIEAGRPIRRAAADIHRKMLEDFRSVRRVMHFGMELHGKILAFKISHRGDGTVARSRQRNESLRHFRDPIAMRHPDLGEHIQHRARDERLDFRRAVLRARRRVNLAAKGMHQ